MSKVDDLLRMSERPPCIDGRTRMTRIGCGRNVSCFQSLTELHCVDQSCKSAVANALQLAIPSGVWQPNFELDVGIRCGLRLRDDPAECRQSFIERSYIPPAKRLRRSHERSRGNTLRRSDCRVGNF